MKVLSQNPMGTWQLECLQRPASRALGRKGGLSGSFTPRSVIACSYERQTFTELLSTPRRYANEIKIRQKDSFRVLHSEKRILGFQLESLITTRCLFSTESRLRAKTKREAQFALSKGYDEEAWARDKKKWSAFCAVVVYW